MDWIDLTRPLTSGMPVYPGDPAVALHPCRTHPQDGYQVMALALGSHSGTHLDAPRHFIAGGRSLDQYPPDRFHGRGLVVDARAYGPRAAIGPEALGPVAGLLAGTEFIFFCTGWERHFGQPAYLEHPHLDPALCRELVALGVRLVGTDTLSPDPVGGDAYPAHQILLGADVLIAENLAGLAGLLGGAAEFWLLPLSIAGADGAPVRAVGRRL